MNWRLAQAEDYGMIKSWWERHNDTPFVPINALPKNGVIVYDDEYDLYVGFLYLTGTSVAWLELITSNPLAPVQNKRGGKEKLYEVIETIAKVNGVEILSSFVSPKTLVNSLKKNGFNEGDINSTNLIKRI